MKFSGDAAASGLVASLHLHPTIPGVPMRPVASMEVVAEMGIAGNERYFGRHNRASGQPSIRQVSLMEREQISEHAEALGLEQIAPGAVRANIETQGVDLVALVGKKIQVGEAILLIAEPRIPCAKMDAICRGSRTRMQQNRQGVLAQVVRSGWIREGDAITVPADTVSP